MRQSAKLLTSFVAGALVALPGLALAQGIVPIDTPSAADDARTTPPQAPVVEATTEEATTEEDDTVAPEPEVQDLDDTLPRQADEDDQEADASHGEAVSALAQCLPSGHDLHGTGMTKGRLMRQAASDGEVALGEGDQALPVSSPEEAQAVCDVVQDLADQAEAPERAVGRPDWAGPKDDDAADRGMRRQGPPAHANDRAGR